MARARNLKPGFFKNDLLAELPPLGRLLFAGLWTIADREGRLIDRPKRIKAEVFPYDECDVEDLLRQLQTRGFIVRYRANGMECIQIQNWHKHQKPHYKEAPSEIPSPPNHKDSLIAVPSVPNEQRNRIFQRDGFKCVKCGVTDNLSIDHIFPRSKGGTNEDDNLQTLCVSCNSRKHDQAMIEPSLSQHQVNIESTKEQVDSPHVGSGILDPSCGIPHVGSLSPAPAAGVNAPYSTDFEAFWKSYPRKLAKREAWRCWQARLKDRDPPVGVVQMVQAATHYRTYCERKGTEEKFIKHAATFLGPDKHFQDFVNGIPETGQGNTKFERNLNNALRLVEKYEAEEAAERGADP